MISFALSSSFAGGLDCRGAKDHSGLSRFQLCSASSLFHRLTIGGCVIIRYKAYMYDVSEIWRYWDE